MGLFEKATKYATEKHSGDHRKGTITPYIVHPMEAAAIVATLFDDEMTDKKKDEVLAAAVLHDTIEDTDATVEDLTKKFGKEVTRLVLADSEDKRRERSSEDTWKERKQETIDYVREKADRYEKMIVLGDKLSNIRSIARDYENLHEKLWNRFNCQDLEEQAWYYSSFIEALMSEFKDKAAYKEYVTLVKRVFGNTKSFDEIITRCNSAGLKAFSQKDFLKRVSKQLEKRGVPCWLGFLKTGPILRVDYMNWGRRLSANILFNDEKEHDEIGIIVNGIGRCSKNDRAKLLELFNEINRVNNYTLFIDDDDEIRLIYRYKIDSSISAAVNHVEFYAVGIFVSLKEVVPSILEMITV